MTNYREILRLCSLGLNNTQIAQSCACSRTTVIQTLRLAQAKGLSFPLPDEMSDKRLAEMLFPSAPEPRGYARPEDVPEHTMFVITTDGQENASHRYTSEQVKKMIERQKGKYGWEFLFIGANIDAVETAARYGISRDRAVNYNADGKGMHILYESVAKAVCNVRASAPLGADWSDEISAYYQRRGNKDKKIK